MKKRLFISVFALSLSLTSCDSYLDINRDPNSPSGENVTTDMIMPTVEMGVATAYSTFLRIATGFYSEVYAHVSTSAQYLNLSQFAITPTHSDTEYTTLTQTCLSNLNTIREKSAADEEWGTYLAATTLRAFVYQILVDCYGEMPYTEAFDDSKLEPKYDDGKTIYDGVIAEIDEALSRASASDLVCTSFLFPDERADKWIEFAKALKLKMLMRMADVENVQSQVAALIADDDFPTTDIAFENCWANETGQMSPFYALEFSSSSVVHNMICANLAIVNSMQIKDIYGNVVYRDPRLSAFFETNANGEYVGGVSGTIYPGTSTLTSWCSPVGSFDMPVYLLTVAEIEFFKAEYYARYGSADDAATHYARAIEASFASAGVEGAAENIVRYPLDVANYKKSIGEAKWVALSGVNTFEAWCELRRLDYPAFGTATGDNFYTAGDDDSFNTSSYVPFTLYTPIQVFGQVGSNHLLERFPYPSTSTSYNTNAPEFPGYTTPVFWAE